MVYEDVGATENSRRNGAVPSALLTTPDKWISIDFTVLVAVDVEEELHEAEELPRSPAPRRHQRQRPLLHRLLQRARFPTRARSWIGSRLK